MFFGPEREPRCKSLYAVGQLSHLPQTSPPFPKPRHLGNPRTCLFQANLVAAFEQSLVSMTCRLRHLAETAEQKVRARVGGRTGQASPLPPAALGLHLPRFPALPWVWRVPSPAPGRAQSRCPPATPVTPLRFSLRTLSYWTYGKP